MPEDHPFIDSLGHVAHGREAVRVSWRSYYVLYPDWVSHREIFSAADRIAVFGAAGGTIAAAGGLAPEHKWRIPAAWLAVVEKSLMREWWPTRPNRHTNIVADSKPMSEPQARRVGCRRGY